AVRPRVAARGGGPRRRRGAEPRPGRRAGGGRRARGGGEPGGPPARAPRRRPAARAGTAGPPTWRRSTCTLTQPPGAGELTAAHAELRERARRFVEDELIPREEMAERAGGVLPEAEVDAVRKAALDARLNGGLHAVEHGGQGWSHVEWCLVEEQIGRSTNGLSCHIPTAYNVLAQGTPEQVDRFLRPGLRGESQDAYAVTEEHAGSDPSAIATTAVRTDAALRIDGEKWFVTSGDVAAVYIVVANVIEDGERLPTLFLVERGTPGIEIVDNPRFTHPHPHAPPPPRS